MKAQLVVSLLALTVAMPSAAAKRLDITSAAASSTYPPEDNFSYDADRARDAKLSTAWVEGEDGSGLGEWLELDLGAEQKVHQLKIWGGMWYSRSYWARANRPKEIEVRWSDGTSDVISLADEMVAHVYAPAEPKLTSTVRLRIKAVYPGTTWLDTPISEVQVFDGQPEAGALVRQVGSSSTLEADADGSYESNNVADGLSDSMWCEGVSDGDGTDEWLQFDFAGQERVSKLHLVNGIGTGLPWWMKANRVTGATLTFSDGTTERVAVRNTMLPQEVEFPAHLTSSVKVTFTEVVKGKEYNDLCISEARFE